MVLTRRAFLPPFPRAQVSFGVPAWLPVGLGLLCALCGGFALGWLSVELGPIPVFALLVGAFGAIIALSDARAGLWAVIGVSSLLPFGVIPVRVGLTVTLLEAASLVTLAVWLLNTLLYRDQRIISTARGVWIILLLAMTAFAFVLGLGRGYTPQTFHDYGKFVLALLLVFVVWNVTRTLDDARRLLTVLIGGAGAASAVGLILYLGGPGLTLNALSRLIPYGYPADRIVRYVEDDPAKPLRLVSTSVDPNSFGGFLAVVLVICVAQLVARHPLLPLRLAAPAATLMVTAVLLTQSRGAWVGVAAGVGLLALLRYRWLAVPAAGVAFLALAFGLGAGFVERLWLGFTLQDRATKLRLAEYRNALAIIREHPWFGVGFGNAPSIELQAGVSSIYLTIAERLGLLGLLVFLIAIASILIRALSFWRRRRETIEGDLTLGLLAGLSCALTVGLVDHYFFNITFPHMAALFWVVCGLLLSVVDAPPGKNAWASHGRFSKADHRPGVETPTREDGHP